MTKPKAISSATRIRVGIGGWQFAPWRNNFYPAKWSQKRELEYASRKVTSIEINSTFYRQQAPATYAKWRDETPDGFVFSLKAQKDATGERVLANAGRRIKAFVFGGIAELGAKLGPISWQFPPYKRFERDDFAAFLDLLPRELDGQPLRHVLEVRHESFKCDEYLALAREHRLPTVFTDSPEYPSFADVTGDFIYARLMRSEAAIQTGYDVTALDAWAARARAWADGGEPADLARIGATAPPAKPRDVYIYFISAAKERNPAAAMALLERLKRCAEITGHPWPDCVLSAPLSSRASRRAFP
jgi:uncharacterized protein YecE (DUF72 family)